TGRGVRRLPRRRRQVPRPVGVVPGARGRARPGRGAGGPVGELDGRRRRRGDEGTGRMDVSDVTEPRDPEPEGPMGDDDERGGPESDGPPLRARLEALVLVVDQPTPEGLLAAAAGATVAEVD